MTRALTTICLTLLFIPSCATAASDERRAYVLSRPHAWVELTLADSSVPDIPVASESAVQWERPHRCSIEVEVGGEPWFSDAAFPLGEAAPYTASSGFRFPVPIGPVHLVLRYGGCRVEREDLRTIVVEAELDAEEALVYDLLFEGAHLTTSGPRVDSVVTLEDVYQAITGRRSPAE